VAASADKKEARRVVRQQAEAGVREIADRPVEASSNTVGTTTNYLRPRPLLPRAAGAVEAATEDPWSAPARGRQGPPSKTSGGGKNLPPMLWAATPLLPPVAPSYPANGARRLRLVPERTAWTRMAMLSPLATGSGWCRRRGGVKVGGRRLGSLNLLDILGGCCSTRPLEKQRGWRRVRVSSYCSSSVWKAGKVQTHFILGSGSQAAATRNRSPRLTVLPRPIQRRNSCPLPAMGIRPSPGSGVRNL
jgi:hypothetical protein